MIVREIYSEVGKDGKRVTGERFVEAPDVLTEEQAAPETARRARETQVQRLQAAATLDLIDAVSGDDAAVARVRETAAEIRRLQAAGLRAR